MSRASRKAFERPDPNDPTLACDNLSDLWPSQAESEGDPTLAVSMLQELFPSLPTRSVAIVDTHVPVAFEEQQADSPDDAASVEEADCLDDYFPVSVDAPTYADDSDDEDDMDDDDTPTRAYGDEVSTYVCVLEAHTQAVDAGATLKGLGAETEIHRAAMDFQRFAKKFHTFATECERASS